MKTLMVVTTLLLAVLMCGRLVEAHPGHGPHGHHGHHGPHFGHPGPHFGHPGWGHGPRWTGFIPPIVIGGSSRTVVVTEPQVVVNDDVRYGFPGEGGTWVTFDGRPAYRFGSYLYIPAGTIDGAMTYRRIYLP
jgi:hypothetical protein